jgi:ABC-type methionine transport system ATPase subunit
MAQPAVRLRGATLRSPSGQSILSGVDWQVDAGGVGVVIGHSGSGKSRMLRLLNRLDEATGGEVELFGQPVADWSPGELRRRVGWVPQRPALGAAGARAAFEIPVELGVVGAGELAERRDRVLAVAGIDDRLLDRSVAALSGGERLRIGLARALLLEPELLLLDEPTSALDGARGAAVLTAVLDWAGERGATLVVATHRIEDVRRLGGELLVLTDGRVDRSGSTAELIDEPAVRELLTGRAEAGE